MLSISTNNLYFSVLLITINFMFSFFLLYIHAKWTLFTLLRFVRMYHTDETSMTRLQRHADSEGENQTFADVLASITLYCIKALKSRTKTNLNMTKHWIQKKNKTKTNKTIRKKSITPSLQTHELNLFNSQKYPTCLSQWGACNVLGGGIKRNSSDGGWGA